MRKSRFSGNSSTDRGSTGNPHPKKIEQGCSERSFTEHAKKTHRRNLPVSCPMRGGIRM